MGYNSYLLGFACNDIVICAMENLSYAYERKEQNKKLKQEKSTS